MSVINLSQTASRLNPVLENEMQNLKALERPQMDFDGPQWVYWAMNNGHVAQFTSLVDVLKQLKKGEWDPSNFSLLLDALAFGPANVTPFAFEWSFLYSPREHRKIAHVLAKQDYSCKGLTKAILATHPFPPSTCYNEMWRGFRGSKLKEQGAYTWLL